MTNKRESAWFTMCTVLQKETKQDATSPHRQEIIDSLHLRPNELQNN